MKIGRDDMFIVFDIDGTLSDPSHRLKYIQGEEKDWDAFFNAASLDSPITSTMVVLHALKDADHRIEFWTGRPERIREETSSWLAYWLGPWAADTPLIMREDGDRRHDVEVKREYIQKRGYPRIVFEDRKRNVEMFREEGIIVYHVAEGDF